MSNRIWILGDIHFGVRASSMEWFETTKNYFENYFIPLLEREVKDGDILIQLGDIFENRQVVNLKINSYVISLFERLGKILPVHTIAGNHDIYYKRSNEVTSLDNLKYIPNVFVYKNPEIIEIGGEKLLMMPWRHSSEQEKETLEEFKDADYVFCHSEMEGILLNANVRNQHGSNPKKFRDFKRVYSGHIHFSQVNGNVYMVGNAYQMTRSDMDNAKGVYLLDLEKGEHTFYENTYSPQFRKINLTRIIEMELGDFIKIIDGNFIDLYIPSDMMIKYNVSYLINLIQDKAKSIDPNIYDEKTFIDIDNVTEELQNGYKNFNVLNLCSQWLSQLSLDEEYSKELNKKLNELYTISTSSYNPEL